MGKKRQNKNELNKTVDNIKKSDSAIKLKKKSKKIRVFLTIVLVLVAIIATTAILFVRAGIEPKQIPDTVVELVQSKILGVKNGDIENKIEIPSGKIKLYSEVSNAVKPENINSSTLKCDIGTINDSANVSLLYDGDPNTYSLNGENKAITLDAGEIKTISYIRYIPNITTQDLANTCVGTKFLASKDNKNFVELGIVNPDVNGNLNLDWHMLEFSGYGEYRYFRLELSPLASFGEIEWVCDNGVKIDNKGNTSFDLVAFDSLENFDGYVTLLIYNKNKVLKHTERLDISFTMGEYTPIIFPNKKVQIGDHIRINTYDKRTMESAIDIPLDYRFTEASSDLKMSNIYSDNMMFQADEYLIISGKAPNKSIVSASLKNIDTGEVYTANNKVDNLSDWEINLGVFDNGGNYELTVLADNQELTFKNITFGDVWVFAGQSNMEFYLCGEDKGEDLLKTKAGKIQSTTNEIRVMNMYNVGTFGAASEIEQVPLNDWNEYWTELTTDRASYLSAISYYFSQELNKRYDRNVGIISVAVGDTEINKWYPYGEVNNTFIGDDGSLYNNRIYPLTKLKIKGILWYQGEADQYRTDLTAERYSDAMSGLINSYREKWNKSDLPFYYAQLTRYGVKDTSEIREGQRFAFQKVNNQNNLGLISLLDIIGAKDQGMGSARTDIHPWQKDIVAERFINYVGHDLYDDTKATTTGPIYQSKEIVGNTVILNFKHTGKLKIMESSQYADSLCEENILKSGTDVNELHEFWISDSSGRFFPANAEIKNDQVIVWSDVVINPTDVIYAWGEYPEMPNLTDDTGLPTYTFNTINGSEFL